jgi:hypothetical protein
MLVQSKKVKFTKLPVFNLAGQALSYVDSYKYLGCFISANLSDDADIDRQRRWLLIRANSIARKFSRCSEAVKLCLFRTFCCNMYCSQLWSRYTKVTMNKLKVTYHNALRWLLKLPRDCSASGMLVSRNLLSFNALRRKYMFSFQQRMTCSASDIIRRLYTPRWHISSSLGREFLFCLYDCEL